MAFSQGVVVMVRAEDEVAAREVLRRLRTTVTVSMVRRAGSSGESGATQRSGASTE